MDLSRKIGDELEEVALCDAARAGDERALRALLGRNRKGLEVYCALMIGEPRTADEALREVLATARRECSRMPASGPARIWLYRIAVRVCFAALEDSCDEFRHRRSFDDQEG